VNLASRLEGLTKHYGARLLVSRAAANAAKGVFIYRTADLVRVKGKEEPVDVLEVLGEGDSAPDWLGPYEDGVSAYRTRRFAEAQSLFERTLALRPDDAPSRMYLARLQPLLKAAPADWDPAHTMYEK
jgi:adenylate cyclase